MKNNYRFSTALFFSVALFLSAHSQTFHKGTFLINLSEGSTYSNFSTKSETPGIPPGHDEPIHGTRDPLTLEYGLSKHWGIGISTGTDIFTIDPNTFYHTDALPSQAKATTSEFTLNASYHFYNTAKTDFSVTGSFGSSSVTLKGKYADASSYQYTAGGAMFRLGLHARYYFYKRLGVLGMFTVYSSNCSPDKIKGNTFGSNYSTGISGYAMEFGFCFRIGK